METDKSQTPDSWNTAFKALVNTQGGVVKTTYRVVLQPFESKNITGFARKSHNCSSAVTELAENGSSRICVCHRVVALNNPGTSARIPVKVFNMSARLVTIPAKSPVCELKEVTVLRSADIIMASGNKNSVSIHQQSVASETDKICEKLDLEESCLTEDQKKHAKEFLQKWQHILTSRPLDFGHTNTVKHEIHLENEQPFMKPYRHISPSLIQEVREHVLEMIEIGAIRESSSPFSSNGLIIRKKDGGIRFCIDHRL